MKYRYFLLTALAVAAIAGCAKNEPAAPNEPVGGEDVRTPAGTSLTAVIHDEEATDKAAVAADNGAVTWTKGDALSVYDGSAFQTFTLQGEGGSASGTFVAENPVAAQVVAVYPAGSHSLSGNNLTLNLPASYTLESTGDANTNVPMIATGNFSTGQLSFKQVGGLFRFTHYTVPPAARKFVFKSEGYKINGDFVIDITAPSPELASEPASSDAESEVTVNFPAPAETVEMSFFIPIPTGAYNNLTISLLDASDNVLWTTTTGSTSGTSTIDIARKSFKKMPAVGGIKTAEELCNLGKLVREGKSFARYQDCDGWITLRNDINMSGVNDWIPIGGGKDGETYYFTGKFDGRGHTIDYLTKTYSGGEQYRCGVFGVVKNGAVIKNLTLGEHSSFNYTRTSSYLRLGGIVCFAQSADVKLYDLTNKASVTAAMPGATKGVWFGGVCGQGRADMKNLRNEGLITYSGTYSGTGDRENYCIGGVIGYIDSGTLTVEHCYNAGKIDINSSTGVYAGGVLGRLNSTRNLNDLINSSTLDVTCTTSTPSPYFGGVVGHMKGVTASNLHNTSAGVVRHSGSLKVNMGGVIGYIDASSTSGTFSGLINNGLVAADNNAKMGGLISTYGNKESVTSIKLSNSAFGGVLQCVAGQGADIGLVIGTDGNLVDASTLSNIKISGSFGPSGSQHTIASAEDYTAHVQTDYSKTWTNDKTKMRLVNPTYTKKENDVVDEEVSAAVKEAVYAKFLAACSYGTMSTE